MTKIFTIVKNDEGQIAAVDGAAIKVCLKADGSIVPCATDLCVVITATLKLIIAHIEKAGKDGASTATTGSQPDLRSYSPSRTSTRLGRPPALALPILRTSASAGC